MGQKITDIKIVQGLCLDMAKKMHTILCRHDIPYYMIGGTLLGSVRHKGFIPWDDDMDFGIPRAYYEKAIKVLQNELQYPLKCVSYRETKICLHESCKIMNMTTRICEEEEYCNENKGIFIDLFPLDYSDGKTGLFSNYMIIKTLVRWQNFRFLNMGNRNIGYRILSSLIKIIFYPLKYKTIPHLIKKYLIKKNGDYIMNYTGYWGKREIIPAIIFGMPTLIKFEDTEFYGVKDTDGYLRCVYGNYMKLPSERERHIHISNVEYI